MSEGGFRNAAMKGRAGRPEGANARMTGKVKPNAIVEGGSQFGTTLHKSDPAKFPNTGRNQTKKRGGDNVSQGPHGVTFVENSTHVRTPSADVGIRHNKTETKNEPELKTGEFETTGRQTASQKGGGEPTQRAYPLKRGYEKSGKTDKRSQKIY